MDPSLTAPETALVIAHLAATWFMVGVIWIVQRVTYPAFRHVGGDGADYHRAHTTGIGPVVGIGMGVEAAAAVLLVWPGVPGVSIWLALAGLAVLGLIQSSTLFLQVPSHGRLSSGMDPAEIDRLVATNWIRTVGWTVRGGIAVAVLLLAGG
jgi:hypothetical protein